MFKIGTRVIYRLTKHSTSPGKRARDVHPSSCGDTYGYNVDKFWIVIDVQADKIILQTRRGKKHTVDPNDPSLRRANWLERIWHRQRFPEFHRDDATT